MKIALENLNKIIKICTKKEIDLIIYMGQYQDKLGVVRGIDYKNAIESIGISKSTFYKLLYSLEVKGIIQINYINEHGYWEVTFCNNKFENEEDYKKGYLKLNFAVLHSAEFKNMTKSEKVIVFHLLRINDFRNKAIKVTLDRIAEWTGKSMRSVLKFIETLGSVFAITKSGNLCLFDCLKGFGKRMSSEIDALNKHLIRYRLNKMKSTSSEKDIHDVCVVFKQYQKANDIEMLISVVDGVVKKFGTLIPAYINTLLKNITM